MERGHRWIAAATLAGIALAGATVAAAQVARSGGNANAQLLEQMQQLASERTALQAENERVKGELAGLKKERDSLKAGQQTVDRRARESAAALAHSNAERDSSAQELTQTKAKMQELIAKFRETIQKLREVETDGATAKQSLAARDHELSECVDRNKALYHLDDEVLTRMEKQGLFTRIAEAEPFTKIKRIQLENLIDEQRAKAGEQRVAEPPKDAAAPPASDQPPH